MVTEAFPVGGAAMGAAIRSLDEAGLPLGPCRRWPAPLQACVNLMLHAPGPVWIAWGDDLTFLYNDLYLPLLGDKHPDALGRPLREVWSEVWSDVSPLLDRALAGQSVTIADMPLRICRAAEAEDAYFSFSYVPIHDEDGAVRGIYCSVMETTPGVVAGQRRDAAEAMARDLHASLEHQVAAKTEERNQIWQMSQDMLGIADARGIWLSVNPAWTRILGWEIGDFVGRTSEWLEHPDDMAVTREEIGKLAAGRTTFAFENRFRATDGTYRTLAWTAVPLDGMLYCCARDMTEQYAQAAVLRSMEEALHQSQKMEVVGQLTGGIAHDFNNLLAGISGALDLMRMRIGQGRVGEIDRYVTAAQEATRRAAALTHRLLAFSRRQTLLPVAVDVNRLVSGLHDMIERTVGPHIQIDLHSEPGLWPTLVDPSQLENALLNLCINARDAMPDGGRIVIQTANRCLDRDAAAEHGVPAGDYLSLCVSDNGTGMPPEVLARVFEPFFTTKALGEGTGLGLSMIYGFALQSGGHVHISSAVGKGSSVCLHLPRHEGDVCMDERAPQQMALSRSPRGGTVLIVDDEPTLRMLLTELVSELGYTAIEAGDSDAGLKLLQSDMPIDLLITDIGLPGGMNGKLMAEAGRQARPDLNVIMITGYAENLVMGDAQLAPGMTLLTKPFAVDALAVRIRAMIDGHSRPI